MKTQLIVDMWRQITHYVVQLDWAYILTFIIIAYGINQSSITDKIYEKIKIRLHKKYRTFLIGFIYGIVLFFLRDYRINQIESLLQSFIFAFVFHKMIIDGLMKYLGRKINTKAKQPLHKKRASND